MGAPNFLLSQIIFISKPFKTGRREVPPSPSTPKDDSANGEVDGSLAPGPVKMHYIRIIPLVLTSRLLLSFCKISVFQVRNAVRMLGEPDSCRTVAAVWGNDGQGQPSSPLWLAEATLEEQLFSQLVLELLDFNILCRSNPTSQHDELYGFSPTPCKFEDPSRISYGRILSSTSTRQLLSTLLRSYVFWDSYNHEAIRTFP